MSRRAALTLSAIGFLAVVGTLALAVAGSAPSASVPHHTPTGSLPVPQTTPAASPSEASWTGPVRADAATLPVVAMVEMPEFEGGGALADSHDSDLPWADIVELWWSPRVDASCCPHVRLLLAARPPRAETLPLDEIISYGFVIETTGDGVPDYEVGILTDAHDGCPFRVWVTDLATGIREEEDCPYGWPVEFSHPDDVAANGRGDEPDGTRTMPEPTRTMSFTFFPGSDPPGFDSGSRIYAWTMVTRGGEVVAWDYAPDAAWARLPDE